MRTVLECDGEQGRRALTEAGTVRRSPDFVVVVGTRDVLCTCDRSLFRNGSCRHQPAARVGLCKDDDPR